jgi:hypothetical protein
LTGAETAHRHWRSPTRGQPPAQPRHRLRRILPTTPNTPQVLNSALGTAKNGVLSPPFFLFLLGANEWRLVSTQRRVK